MPFTLPDRVYEFLKWILVIVLPAFGTLYSIVADELGFGGTESVLRILFAVGAFLGIILGISTYTYNNSDAKYDGVIDPKLADDSTAPLALQFNSNPDSLTKKRKDVLLKVDSLTNKRGV